MISLSPPAAILFDWDTTLVDNWTGIVGAWNHALSELGKPPTMTRRQAIALSGGPPTENCRDVFGEEDAQLGASLFYEGMLSATESRVIEGSAEMLDEFHAAGLPMAVVSNKKGFNLRQEIARLGWEKYFFANVGAGDAAFDKPHPAPILYALEQRMIPAASDVWMVGDMHSDMQAARRAGVTAILIETTAGLGLGLEGDLKPYPPHARVRNASALRELVKGVPRTI